MLFRSSGCKHASPSVQVDADVVQVNAHLSAQRHTGVKRDMACTGVASPQVSCQDVKFKYLEPYICDWYEPSCGTIALVGRNMPGVGIGDGIVGTGNEPAALDVEVVLQEYDAHTGMWNDRARCGNLQRSINVAGTKVDNTQANDYNNNEKELLNDAFGSTRPAQRASQLGGLEKDYPPWTETTVYIQGNRITYNGKCYVAAAGTGVPAKISPSEIGRAHV